MRSFNFNAGPAAMPLSVLETLQRDLVDYQGRGLSVLEMSHRSSDFIAIAQQAEADLRTLLAVPDEYSVLFMQGGATSQFALTVHNLDTNGRVAFANTGYWSDKASKIAALSTDTHEVVRTSREELVSVPPADHWLDPGDASYLHVTDNETIDGIRLGEFPDGPIPTVVDMSSSILSRPLAIERYGLIYAGAQKNIGPAGITVVLIRNALLERSAQREHLAPVFSYAAMNNAGSMLNTPPTFAWYAAGLVFQWLLEEGGLSVIANRNERQAESVYAAIDASEVFSNNVHPDNRSVMNIPFQVSRPEWEAGFLQGGAQRGLIGLKGHKSVGGLRASLYNAVTDKAVDALVDYLHEFARNPKA
ncbi:MAG: 3-phosphoserine/phosphohydroxythreonine transaminase [Granulosicoccus sp.]